MRVAILRGSFRQAERSALSPQATRFSTASKEGSSSLRRSRSAHDTSGNNFAATFRVATTDFLEEVGAHSLRLINNAPYRSTCAALAQYASSSSTHGLGSRRLSAQARWRASTSMNSVASGGLFS